MQNTLTFEYKGKKYVSKPFDFEALCLINEEHINSELERASIYRIAASAVDHMFEGTEATDDIIQALPPAKRAKLCAEAFGMYAAELDSLKNE